MADYSNVAPPSSRARWVERPVQRRASTSETAFSGEMGGPPRTASEDFKVPDGMVGFNSGGMPDRSVTLTGSPDAIQAAKRLLTEIVEKGRPTPAFHHNEGPGMSVQEIMVPASKAGLVIGKGGETIKSLQERAGVKMVMIQEGPQNTGADKPLRISGEAFKVQQAKELVMELIRDQGFREQRGEYGSRLGGGDSLDVSNIEVPVPRFRVGTVIGSKGQTIKMIQSDTGVRIQFKQDDGTTPERIAQIMGPPEQAQKAADIIAEILRFGEMHYIVRKCLAVIERRKN
ncbi:far upstream element-binding protein 1-like isoform X3 [Gadus macrocephalus]|uniref:far upstream element-binding protein 1-like isoform X3 n=1 Tax=Gadus macrocephalus TaxID=80720 RepID=UPI0028CB5111|nr:far upstream element-binding protein 1-like isoform X3 [Gadus macrocephalus]